MRRVRGPRRSEPCPHTGDQVLAAYDGTTLEIFNGRKRSSACFWRCARCTILSNEHVIVVLVRVHGSAVDTHISDETTDQQRVHPEPPQKEIEICGEETAVATLWDNDCLLYTSPSPRD